MSPILTSQGMVLATAMVAVSGTVILLAFRLQKSFPPPQFSVMVNPLDPPAQSPQPLPRSSASSASSSSDRRKKKRVHFAADVVDPVGNSDEYRKKFHLQQTNGPNCHSKAANSSSSPPSPSSASSSTVFNGGKVQGMPANRVALYRGILRDRVHHRATYSY